MVARPARPRPHRTEPQAWRRPVRLTHQPWQSPRTHPSGGPLRPGLPFCLRSCRFPACPTSCRSWPATSTAHFGVAPLRCPEATRPVAPEPEADPSGRWVRGYQSPCAQSRGGVHHANARHGPGRSVHIAPICTDLRSAVRSEGRRPRWFPLLFVDQNGLAEAESELGQCIDHPLGSATTPARSPT